MDEEEINVEETTETEVDSYDDSESGGGFGKVLVGAVAALAGVGIVKGVRYLKKKHKDKKYINATKKSDEVEIEDYDEEE